MKIAHLFFEINMSNSHKGLTDMLKKTLNDNECAIFVNKKWSAIKMLTPSNTILYHRNPDNSRIEPDAIKYLPYCVQGSDLNYDSALRSAITAKYKKAYPNANR